MAVELATAYVSLTASAKGIGSSVAKELGDELRGPLDKAGNDAGDTASRGFVSRFGGGLGALKGVAKTAAGVFAAGFASVIGAGVLLEGIGAQFDDAFDSLRVGTGATGDELTGLQDSFRNVFRDVPTTMGDASAAIGEVNRRLDLTGRPLEDLSTQFLNLSRITGEDLGSTVKNVSGLFNQFGIDAKDQGGRLDFLFRASQQTGISVGELAAQMTDSGTALREVGLSFEDSAGLLGLLAKSGLSAGDVMPAVSRALATAAKEGRPAADVFRETFDAIKNAPNDTVAAGLALDVFGAKAGPKFAALIRDGKLAYEDFTTSLQSGDTINAAAAATDDWREKLTLLKNRALLALEPVAARVFDGITRVVTDALPKVQNAISQVTAGFRGAGDGGFFSRLGEAAARAVEIFEREWPKVKRIVSDALTTAQQTISGFVEAVTVIWQNFGPQIIAFVTATWDQIKGTIDAALQIIRGIVQTVTSLIRGDWSGVWEGIRMIVSGVWDGIVALATGFVGRVRAVLSVLLEILTSIFRSAWEGAKNAVSTGVTNVITLIKGLPGKAVAALAAIGSALVSRGAELIRGLLSGITSLVTGYVNLIRGLPGKAVGALAGIGSALFSAGADMIGGFIRGIASMAGRVADAALAPVRAAVNAVKGFLGIGSPSKLFAQIGRDMMRGMAVGVKDGAEIVVTQTVRPAAASAAAFTMSPAATPPAPIMVTGNTFIGSGPEVTRLLSAKITEGRRAGVQFLGS